MHKKSILTICAFLILGVGIVPARAGLQDGLVSYFKLDEISGTSTADASGNGHNGTLIGTNLSWAPGYDGGALKFATPATGDVADRLEFPAAGMSVTAGTVCAWGYMTDPQPASSGRYIFGHTAQPQFSSRIQVYMQDATNVSTKLDIGIGDNHSAKADIMDLPLKQWFHVALTWSSGAYAVYVNGAQVASGAYTGLTALNTIANFGNDASNAPYEAFCGMLDEARVYNRALTAAEVKAIFQMLPSSRIAAQAPSPADKAVDVPWDSVLSWTKSEFAATHDVYLGKTFADVNNASRTKPAGVLVSQGQTATTYTPAPVLDFGQTYYWRVDEVNKAPDNTIFKGNVWSFTVEPYSYPLTGVAATASSSQIGMGPENTVNGSGLNASDQHGTDPTTMWVSKGTLPNWIQYQLDAVYKLDKLLVWNSNQMIETYVGFGAKDVTIEYSVDGTTWTTLAGVPQFAQATGSPTYTANTTVNFGSVSAKYVKLTIDKTWGGLPTASLAEVRFFSVPLQARAPQPAAGATGQGLTTTLSWRPGRDATSHKVFFGTDPNAMAKGTIAAQTVATHAFDPGALTFGTKYYWKVDEVGATSTYPGVVWSFTTQEFAVVDDFESYNDDKNRIYDTWIDGLTDGKSGSVVGYLAAPFAEQTIVHGGKQSMPMEYNNVKAPYYSEATRTFTATQDWTANGVDTLSLWFRGRAAAFMDNGDGTYAMTSSGTDIWNNGDQFRFAYKQLTGNGSMIARVDSVANTNVWAKAGVMIRQSVDPGSTHAFMPITPGGSGAGNGASFQRRLTAAGASTNDDKPAPAIAPPYWVKIDRTGNNLSGYISPDGKTWTQLGTAQTITMTNPVLIGLALCSHDATLTTTGTFSNVSTTGTVTGSWQVATIGMAMPTNDPAPLYLTVTDKAGKTKTVVNPNPSASATPAWTEWRIPLSGLTGVSLTTVQKLTLGVGDKTSPKAGAAGMLYFDDIGYGHPVK